MAPGTVACAILGVTVFASYVMLVIAYRLILHPLARFPGPSLAGMTYLYELYYDVFAQGGGQYTNEVERMHDKFGPVVRVTPDEVHVRDPEWASTLYAGPGKIRIKDPRLAEVAGTGNGCFGTPEPQMHRRRRQPVSAFYSRYSISRMQGKIWQRANHLADVMRRHHEDGSVVEGRIIFLGWSNDTLRTFTFGRCLSLLDNVDQARKFQQMIHKIGSTFGWLHFATGATKVLLSLPPGIFNFVKTPMNFLVDAHVDMIRAAKLAHDERRAREEAREAHRGEKNRLQIEQLGASRGKGDAVQDAKTHDHLFQAILGSEQLSEAEKLPQRLAHEGLEMLLAGSDPTARTMSVLFYHLNANPAVVRKLRSELLAVLPSVWDETDIQTLERLPFLNACIKEALRLGQTTDHRFGLIAPNEDLSYRSGEHVWTMRRGVTVSMTPARAGLDARYFPEPRLYRPDRWLLSSIEDGDIEQKEEKEEEVLMKEDQRLAVMNKVFIPFAKGTRNCVGEFFAMTELRVATARIFRAFDFELYDTVRERDVDVSWNHMSGEPRKGAKGLRFRVIGLHG